MDAVDASNDSGSMRSRALHLHGITIIRRLTLAAEIAAAVTRFFSALSVAIIG